MPSRKCKTNENQPKNPIADAPVAVEEERVILASNDDPAPEDLDSEEGYAWAARQPRRDYDLKAAIARWVARNGKPTSSPVIPQSGSVPVRMADVADLYCELPCGRKTPRSRKYRDPLGHRTEGNNKFCEACARAKDACPCCGKRHGRFDTKKRPGEQSA